MSQLEIIAISIALGALVYFLHKRANAGQYSSLPLPPGPKGLPLIGNLREMPTSREWVKYHDWAKEYSKLLSWLLLCY